MTLQKSLSSIEDTIFEIDYETDPESYKDELLIRAVESNISILKLNDKMVHAISPIAAEIAVFNVSLIPMVELRVRNGKPQKK